MIAVPMGFTLLDDLIGFKSKPKTDKVSFIKKATVVDLFAVMESNPNQRFELINGQIIAMSNASLTHNMIMNNFVIGLGSFLRKGNHPCRLYSDTQCKVYADNYFHPDFAVICHKPAHQKYLENPVLVGEIFSSNRNHDISFKLPLYQQTPSIQEILYLEQKIMQLTLYRRNATDSEIWEAQTYKQGDIIHLQSIDFSMLVDDFYIDVEFGK